MPEDNRTQTIVHEDRIKSLLDRAFNEALYMHYQWPVLSDRLTPFAEFCAGVVQLSDILPSDLIADAKARVLPLDRSTIEQEANVKEAYRDWTATYDQPGNPLIAVEELHTLQLIGDFRSKVVANIRCGTGRYSRSAISQGRLGVPGARPR